MKHFLLVFAALCLFLVPAGVYAQRGNPTPAPVAGNSLFTPGATNRPPIQFPNLISRFTSGDFLEDAFGFVVELIATIGGIAAFGYIMYGGFKFVTSAGNPATATEGKKMIIGAIIGMFIIALAYVVVLFVRDQIVSMSQSNQSTPTASVRPRTGP